MEATELQIGEIYYICGFQDSDARIPSIEALEYVGKNCSSNRNLKLGGDYYVFVDAAEKGRLQTDRFLRDFGLKGTDAVEPSGETETILPAGSLDGISDLDGVIDFFINFRQRQQSP